MQESKEKATDGLRRMTEDVAEVKRVLKQKSKNELIQSILNLMHNQLSLIDAVQALQSQLKIQEQVTPAQESKEAPDA